jgi:hypothetical protein
MNAPLPTAPNSAAVTTTHPAEIKAVLEEQLLDSIYEGLALARSYIESMMQATVRGDRHELSIRRRQIRDALKYAYEAHALLNGSAR